MCGGHPLLQNTAGQLNLYTKRVVFLCSVDSASLYNLVNETNLVHAFIRSVFRQLYL